MNLRLQLMALCSVAEREEFQLRAPIPLEQDYRTLPVPRAVGKGPGTYGPRPPGRRERAPDQEPVRSNDRAGSLNL